MSVYLALATGLFVWTAVTPAATALDPQAGCSPGSAIHVDKPPRISPDYVDVTIPPNIAPLNFVIHEPGQRYLVRIQSTQGRPIEIASRSVRSGFRHGSGPPSLPPTSASPCCWK